MTNKELLEFMAEQLEKSAMALRSINEHIAEEFDDMAYAFREEASKEKYNDSD